MRALERVANLASTLAAALVTVLWVGVGVVLAAVSAMLALAWAVTSLH